MKTNKRVKPKVRTGKRSAGSLHGVVRAKTLEQLISTANKSGLDVTLNLEPVLRINISNRMEAELSWLVASGLFGANAAAAARRILEEWMWHNQQRIAALRPNSSSTEKKS